MTATGKLALEVVSNSRLQEVSMHSSLNLKAELQHVIQNYILCVHFKVILCNFDIFHTVLVV
jgi:hypothetical protein